MKKQLLIGLLLLTSGSLAAQRPVDNLDRGLVAVPTGSTGGSSTTNFVSWRRLGTEYYDVTYNLYRDGTRIATGLTTTSYDDSGRGYPTSSYQVAAVVRGTEQARCDAVKPWTQYVYKLGSTRTPTGYLDIPLATVYDRNGADVTDHYSPNDAEMADLDGDGQLEMIIKRLNTVDAGNVYLASNTTEFVVIDAYDIDWQTGAATLLWRIDCGPNMVSLNSTEINVIAYDWDGDGRAEVVLRGADNMIVYGGDGQTRLYTIGDMAVNTRDTFSPSNGLQYAWTHTGSEYLIYMDGQTGAKYQVTDYPLKRLESGESSLNTAWGDGYGHRSSKYFFGAPFLDGRTPSLFLGRGIYTRHKFIAMDLDKGSHQWQTRWTWACNDSSSPWYGNGYHNFVIADVDEDGRDEIVYGSMVIDDNGKGLSTTGYEHGDAQHVGDFDPWRPGLEFFGCLEDKPYYGCNYRNATTGEVYYKFTSTGDDGRALMANFSNSYPGSLGRSSGSPGMMSGTTDELVAALSGDSYIAWGDLNFRIYWDGDLCSEILNSPGTAKEAKIEKPGTGRLFTSSGCNMNNDSKNNACFQGDLTGDWREEIVVRCGTNVRVYTTGISTAYSLPTLWHDHQYRQAMVWQMMAYNQPPHLSYFLGEMEGYTVAPPPLLSNGRTEIASGGSITAALNDRHVMACEAADMTIAVSDGASPWVFTDNAPSWVQGTDENGTTGTKVKGDGSVGATNLPAINHTYYTHTLTGGAFTGAMHLSKQGDGTLVLPSVTQTYTGTTTVWAGTLQFDGTLASSPVTLKRFATLNSTGGTFNGGITMEYGARLNVGGATAGTLATVSTTTLTLGYGSRVALDVNGKGDGEHDWLNAATLAIDDTKAGVEAWESYGPAHLTPVVELNLGSALADGLYPLGTVGIVEGDLSKVELACDAMDTSLLSLVHQDGTLYLKVTGAPTANEAAIAVVGMTGYADVAATYPSASATDYYLPVVGITATATDGQTPTLSGTFTGLDGQTVSIGSEESRVLFSEDFEGSTTPSDYWARNNSSFIFTPTYAGSEGQCIGMRSSADRGDYTPITADYTGVEKYTIDFDAYFNNAPKTTDFAVMSKSHAASWTFNYGYHWLTNAAATHNAYLFYMQRGAGSTTFTVNERATMTLANSTWYHFTLTVDAGARTVDYAIAKKVDGTPVASGTYTLPVGESAECDGIYVRNGRYNYEPGGEGIDNIVVAEAATLLDSYTFTAPGTLTVKASLDGYASSEKTFTAAWPYFKQGDDYVAVAVHDEQLTTEPTASTPGNATLHRTGLGGSTSWATLVVPFDLTVAQAKETFGDDVVVGNLVTTKGDAAHIYFETASGAIHANTPCLVKNVTKEPPYLVMGITSTPGEAIVSDACFDFIGFYANQGTRLFNLGDYFFNAPTGLLSTVKADGTGITMPGYRAYFHARTSDAAKSVGVVFDGAATGIALPSPTRPDKAAVYDLWGRKVDGQRQSLPKGVYIVNGKRMVK